MNACTFNFVFLIFVLKRRTSNQIWSKDSLLFGLVLPNAFLNVGLKSFAGRLVWVARKATSNQNIILKKEMLFARLISRHLRINNYQTISLYNID